jgi:hypothetical protein
MSFMCNPNEKSEIQRPIVSSISCFRLSTTLYYSSQRWRIRTPPDEFSGAFVGKELIVFYCDRNIPFHSLDFVRSHGAPQLLNQGTAPMPEFAGTRFRHAEPIIRRKAILFNAISFKMGQPNNELSCHEALLGGFEVGLYRMTNLSSEWSSTRCLTVAFLE